MPSTRRFRLIAPACALVALLASCSPTTIVDDLATTTTAPNATTTTLAAPTGTIPELLQQLVDVSVGLGDAIVERDSSLANARLSRAVAIGEALEPKIREAGVDLVEDVQRIVGLVRTAVERKRPADADKAMRFAILVKDAAETLLA